jgi:hypothetical protein
VHARQKKVQNILAKSNILISSTCYPAWSFFLLKSRAIYCTLLSQYERTVVSVVTKAKCVKKVHTL